MSNISNNPIPDTVVIDVSTKYGIGGGTVGYLYGFLTSTEGAIFIGVIVTILGMIITYYYQRKRDKREIKEQELHLELALEEDRRKDELHKAKLRYYTQPRGSIKDEDNC